VSACPAVPVSDVDVVVPEPEPVPESLDVLDVPDDDVEVLDDELPEELLEERPSDESDELLLDPLLELQSRSESLEPSPPESPPQRCDPLIWSEPNRNTRCSPAVLVELLESSLSLALTELVDWLEDSPLLELPPLPLEFDPQPESADPLV
jgi:hypothetical protein